MGVASNRVEEIEMNRKQLTLACCTVFFVSSSAALAGPCSTDQTAKMKDAGAGPTVGSTARNTAGGPNTGEHPPTSTMNRATGDVATSSQDAQRQMQGQPTAAQQAEGAKATGQTADQGC
jgi:hypothetical protein